MFLEGKATGPDDIALAHGRPGQSTYTGKWITVLKILCIVTKKLYGTWFFSVSSVKSSQMLVSGPFHTL